MIQGDDKKVMTLDHLWTTMQQSRGDIEQRTEEYARWTVPAVCPMDSSKNSEQDKGNVAIGARLVNHLANKIVDTMFPHERPFFALSLTQDARMRLRREMGEDEEAQFAEQVREVTRGVEEAAMRTLRLPVYRPQAIEAAKHLIVSGNAILRRLPDGRRTVYGIRDHCIRRDVSGQPYEVLLRDAKKVGGLPKQAKMALLERHPDYKDDTDVMLWTHFKFDGARWVMQQGVQDVLLPEVRKFKQADCPILCLVWSLSRGDDYGRGLVEDHAPAFHQIDVLTLALVDLVGILADVKFLVDPASMLDVAELNDSSRGSYHQGRKDDISTPERARNVPIGEIIQIIQGLERELAQAFLLQASGVRDAERVTAEEIRLIAMELESAFGGLYSRLAIEWQQHEAEYAVSQINFNAEFGAGAVKAFEVVVTTGLESLSREGQLDNLRRAFSDLQMLDAVPEDLRAAFNPLKIASFIFTNNTVRWQEFMYTAAEMEANQQNAMQQQQQLAGIDTQSQLQVEAGKKAIKDS